MAMQDSNRPLTLSPNYDNPGTAEKSHLMPSSGSLTPGVEGHAVPPALNAAPTVPALFQALRRRWLLATALAVVSSAAVVVLLLFLWPAKYVATSRLQVPYSKTTTVFANLPSEDVDPTLYRANLAAMVKYPNVLAEAVKKCGSLAMIRDKGADAALEWLEVAIKTDYELGPQTLRIKLSGDQPLETAKILEAVTQAFIDEVDRQETQKRQLLLKMLDKKIGFQETELDGLRKRLQQQQDSLGVSDPKASLTNYENARAELSQAKALVTKYRLEQIKLEGELQSLKDRFGKWKTSPVSASELEQYFKTHPAIQQLDTQIGVAYKNIRELRKTLKNPGQAIQNEKSQIETLKKEKQRLQAELRPEIEQKLRELERDKLQTAVALKDDALKTNKRQQASIEQQAAAFQKRVDSLSPQYRETLEMMSLKSKIDRMEAGLKNIGERKLELEVEPVHGKRVQWPEQQVKVPRKKDMSRQAKVSAVAAFCMFGCVMFGVTWWEFRKRRISAAVEVSQGLGIHLVGTLPPVPARTAQRVSANGNGSAPLWQNRLLESVDAMRTMLIHAARSEGLKVVMITSALDGEGKTSVASQLASSLARAWRKTLLLDGDLRNPAIHNLFDIPPEPGFCEVLRAEVDVTEVIQATPVSRLWAMPAGVWDAHAVQALAQDDVQQLFNQLKDQYDFVIVDSGPVLPVADTLQLAQHVDGVLFSVLRDVSRVPSVYAAYEKLRTLDIRTLGAVVVGDNNGSLDSNYLQATAFNGAGV